MSTTEDECALTIIKRLGKITHSSLEKMIKYGLVGSTPGRQHCLFLSDLLTE